MITAEAICRAIPGLSRTLLLQWVEQDLVRPEHREGEPIFHDIDIARVRLIVELRNEMAVEETTLPLILSLLDQLYATRRRLRIVLEASDAPFREKLSNVLE